MVAAGVTVFFRFVVLQNGLIKVLAKASEASARCCW